MVSTKQVDAVLGHVVELTTVHNETVIVSIISRDRRHVEFREAGSDFINKIARDDIKSLAIVRQVHKVKTFTWLDSLS